MSLVLEVALLRRTTRLPSSWSVATVVLGGEREDAFDDHSRVSDGVVRRSSSPWMLSMKREVDGLTIGCSRFATQTTV
jgi:hypothetical protein